MSDEDQWLREFIDSFLEDNTHLFTLLGVFGGISVYLSTIPTKTSGNLAIEIGIISSLVLFFSVGMFIWSKFFSKWEEVYRHHDKSAATRQPVNILLYALGITFIFMIGSISLVVVSFSEAVIWYLILVGFGLGTVGWIIIGSRFIDLYRRVHG